MFARLSQISRQLRPASSILRSPLATRPSMAASAAQSHLRATLHTAACLIIGDEVLNGKTKDSNSAYLARYCFSLGINLQRVEVIADDADEISEAVVRMSNRYNAVFTSGGIGPTHDDITYQSIASAFNLPLVLHDEAFERMKKLSRPHPSQPNFSYDTPSPALDAKKRMVILPYDSSVPDKDQVRFVADDLWVPVSVVNGNVHILPGVPRLFERLLDGLRPVLAPRVADPGGKGTTRILFSTPLAESEVAGYLTELSEKVKEKGIKVGSYPRWGKGRNTVTLVGRDGEYMESLVKEVEKGVKGRRVGREDEDDEGAGSDKDT
ncbi:3'-phosphoadenosine 5'-phosphosulfate sulfotransferase [Myriangium duriaei CBS 260.36]|uniref:3'-phosphoadenosine 5'-phosphosulfate sulfotransferase n=1 Tax=Myriangium duriaei CBS 260.36 TaxID=1168546 RepID=A0A9P4MFI2_9PEZI|nr:3'-phosphoadenosine 5'-phosphosulfate sulfotransferase [Myriangium duriaei CBS 260.36]